MRPNFAHFVAVLSFNASVAGLGVLMLPIAIGALAKSGVDARTLGLIAFLELGGGALTAILASARMSKVDPLWLCAAGALLAAVGNLASAAADDTVLLLVALRPLVGIGTGLMQAAGLATVARLRRPERMYGYIGMAPCFTALVGFAIAPHLIALTGDAAGVFAFQGALALLNTLALVSERRRVHAFVGADAGAVPSEDKEPAVVSASAVRLDLHTWALSVGCSFALAFADSAIWAFVAPMGESSGIPLADIGAVLMISAIIGAFGPLSAGWIGDRFGMLPPLLAGQFLMISLGLVMVLTHQAHVFAIALYARVFVVLFLGPMYNGLFARVDPLGRLVAASAGFSAIGYALGPLVGGQLVSIPRHDFVNLGILGAAAACAALLFTVLVVARHKEVLARRPNGAVAIAP